MTQRDPIPRNQPRIVPQAGSGSVPSASGPYAIFKLVALCLSVTLVIVGGTVAASQAWSGENGRTVHTSALGSLAIPRSLSVSGDGGGLVISGRLADLMAQEDMLAPFDPGSASVRLEILPWEFAASAPTTGCGGLLVQSCTQGFASGDAWVSLTVEGKTATGSHPTASQLEALAQMMIERWSSLSSIRSPMIFPRRAGN